jgi:hypothetical protein
MKKSSRSIDTSTTVIAEKRCRQPCQFRCVCKIYKLRTRSVDTKQSSNWRSKTLTALWVCVLRAPIDDIYSRLLLNPFYARLIHVSWKTNGIQRTVEESNYKRFRMNAGYGSDAELMSGSRTDNVDDEHATECPKPCIAELLLATGMWLCISGRYSYLSKLLNENCGWTPRHQWMILWNTATTK